MPWDDASAEPDEAQGRQRFTFDPSLIAAAQPDLDAAFAAGERLAANADPDAVPLPVIRLPASVEVDERP